MLNFKKARTALGLSQALVANKLGIAQNTYSQYETGVREPSISLLHELSHLYEVSIDYLLGNVNINYDDAHLEWYLSILDRQQKYVSEIKDILKSVKPEDRMKVVNLYKKDFDQAIGDTFVCDEFRLLGQYMNFFEFKGLLSVIKVLFPDVYEAYDKIDRDTKSFTSIWGFDYKNNKFKDVDSAINFLNENDCLDFNAYNYKENENLRDKIFNKAMILKERLENNEDITDLLNNTGRNFEQEYIDHWMICEKEKIAKAIKIGKEEKDLAKKEYEETIKLFKNQ